MLGLEITERVPMLEQPAQARLSVDPTNVRLASNLLDDNLVTGPDPELLAHVLG